MCFDCTANSPTRESKQSTMTQPSELRLQTESDVAVEENYQRRTAQLHRAEKLDGNGSWSARDTESGKKTKKKLKFIPFFNRRFLVW